MNSALNVLSGKKSPKIKVVDLAKKKPGSTPRKKKSY